MSGLLWPLEVISTGYPDPELRELAGDLRVCMATLGAVWSTEMRERAEGKRLGLVGGVLAGLQQELGTAEMTQRELHRDGEGREERESDRAKPAADFRGSNCSPFHKHKGKESVKQSPYQQALMEAQDPEIPVRGHGLASLARMVEARDKETATESASLLELFRVNLSHSDSYIYLPAIGGCVALASRQPVQVLTILCREYAVFSKSHSTNKIDSETGQLRANQSSGREEKTTTVELRLKLGEALVRVSRECGESLLSSHANVLLGAVLSNARDPHPLVRASALSNLADVCQLLGHSFGSVQHEVSGAVCVYNMLSLSLTKSYAATI